jgi:Holliday junction DNA helicase RuvA
MIIGLKGAVDEIGGGSISLDVHGVIYEVFLTIKDCENISIGENIKLHIVEIIREDSYSLYGFLRIETKLFFNELLKINGIGAKVAIAILSTISESEFVSIIETNDEKALVKVPKIGLKTAKRVIAELIDKVDTFREIVGGNRENSEKDIAVQALEQLGFNRSDILQILKETELKKHQEMIKFALQKLAK